MKSLFILLGLLSVCLLLIGVTRPLVDKVDRSLKE